MSGGVGGRRREGASYPDCAILVAKSGGCGFHDKSDSKWSTAVVAGNMADPATMPGRDAAALRFTPGYR